MSKEIRKKVLIISVLAALLIALVCVYFFVIVPLMTKEPEQQIGPPVTESGEGLYGNSMVTIYPQLDKTNIEYLEIKNKNGAYAFHKHYDSAYMEVEDMRIKGHERINFDQSLFSMLLAYVYLPVSYQSHTAENAPMRGVSEETMRDYGVTEDTCQASYTVGYRENGEIKYHTVYIGDASFSQETTYYVSLKGRNSIYRFHQEGVESCMLVGLESYLSPFVYGKFESSMVAMATIERFKIGLSDPANQSVESLVEIIKSGQNVDGTANVYDLYYKSRGTGKITRTGTNVARLSTAFTALYTYFAGDKVMCINPDKAKLDEYGLGANDPCYYITAQLSSDKEDIYSLQVSELIDGYYYTLSTMYGEGNALLIRVPKATLSFLDSDDKAIFEWAGTDISSLFYEYLMRDEKENAPGMFQMDIRIQKRDDHTGEVIYNISDRFNIADDGNGSIVATQQSNGTKYKTENEVNQFINYYMLLVSFPFPWQFNNMSTAEIEALMAQDEAIVFELVARDNSDKVFKYTYYQIDNGSNVMVVTREGHMDGGVVSWDEEPQVSFNTTLNLIDILRDNFQNLISGKAVESY
ncbi:MAG: hypothetical protein J6B45_03530 [Clostridia bacterium]|nr:hypothetical protein [Clostridia bacterium]